MEKELAEDTNSYITSGVLGGTSALRLPFGAGGPNFCTDPISL